MSKLLNCILGLSLTAVVVSAEFPKGVTKCHNDDLPCLKQTTQKVLNDYPGGLPELNLLPLDPLHVNNFAMMGNPESPVNIELKFQDLDIIGLRTAVLKSIKGFNFKERNVFEATVPELLLKGKYTGEGRVLFLPITGKGDSLITCKNINLKYSFDLKQVERKGNIYGELKNVKLEIDPELVQYLFNGLFNGDKALGDNMNKFLNENWREIFKELKPFFAKALGLVAKGMINNVLSKMPFDELFL